MPCLFYSSERGSKAVDDAVHVPEKSQARDTSPSPSSACARQRRACIVVKWGKVNVSGKSAAYALFRYESAEADIAGSSDTLAPSEQIVYMSAGLVYRPL